MSAGHDPAEAIGQVTHYFGHRSVAAVRLSVTASFSRGALAIRSAVR